jgi:hypothetical protein
MMMAEVNSDEMCSIIAAMIAKQEQTMTDVNVVVVVDNKSKATQEKISPRDVRSFTFLPDTTATNEDDKGEDTGVIRKGDNDDAAAAAAAPTQGQDEEQLMTPAAAATKRSGGVLEEYAITFLRDVLRHSVTFTQYAYNMRVQEWDVARALEFYYNEKGKFSIEDYDNEEEDNDDDDSYDDEEEEDDDDDDDSQYSFDESSTDKDEYNESMSDNHKETMAEVNDINLTTTTLTTDIKEFTDYLIHPIFAEFNFHVEMEIKGIVLLRNALIDYLTLVQKCDLSNKEEVVRIMRHPPASPTPPRQVNNCESHFLSIDQSK